MEIADFAGHVKLDVDGGGGSDELSLIRGLPAVQLTADKLLLADFDLKLSGEIKYAGFDAFSYLGDAPRARSSSTTPSSSPTSISSAAVVATRSSSPPATV